MYVGAAHYVSQPCTYPHLAARLTLFYLLLFDKPGCRRQLHLLPQLRGAVLWSDPDRTLRGAALQASSQQQVGSVQVQVMNFNQVESSHPRYGRTDLPRNVMKLWAAKPTRGGGVSTLVNSVCLKGLVIRACSMMSWARLSNR